MPIKSRARSQQPTLIFLLWHLTQARIAFSTITFVISSRRQDNGVNSLDLNLSVNGDRVRARSYRRESRADDNGLADAWTRYLGGDETAEVTGGNG